MGGRVIVLVAGFLGLDALGLVRLGGALPVLIWAFVLSWHGRLELVPSGSTWEFDLT